jgi:hypothetical protein
MLNFVENLLENERDPRSGPMNDQDHSLSLSDPDRSLVLSHFLTNFLQNSASCQTSFKGSKSLKIFKISLTLRQQSVHTEENSQILTVSNKKYLNNNKKMY